MADSVTATVGGSLDPWIRDLLARATGDVSETMLDEVRAFYEGVRAEWPVAKDRPGRKGGFSKSQLDYGVQVKSATTIEAFVASGAPYTMLIKALKHAGKQTARVLLFDPAEAVADRIAARVADKLVDGR